ncbi:YdcF family protein [Nocardia sp. CDC159]|uniref:YdcF family protein n=1 Tax=Nocardia pulmonis TaxID=2951408 RepID=A0A9X2ECA7_9NOCA|nr:MULTISPECIES: YdcF family protein [Nocardia]MCM6778227.1 YdcF family protein [Nocardia pulmonis]MCM6791116.1 YdcF family protein [Nocardia sp. CDC159]
MGTMALLYTGTVLAIVGAIRMALEPRRLSTGFVLLAAVAALVIGLGGAAAELAPVPLSRVGMGLAVGLVPVVVGIALIVNGITVIRREGAAPITLMPLVVGFGLLLLVAVAVAVSGDRRVPAWIAPPALAVGALGLYLVAHLAAFGGQALLYSNLPDRPDCDAVVILGCGLNRVRVTPLLAARLDRGIRAYRAAVATGAEPLVVTCGGRGPDEETAEADAMGRYLAAHGIPRGVIVRERRSRTTAENLRNALRELESRGLLADRIRITVVTSNFHVLRTAALTRRLGVDAQVLGARTAGYFLPAAFLREFVAVLATHYRRTHVAVAAVTVAALVTIAADAALTR